jgi:hypothetical protein
MRKRHCFKRAQGPHGHDLLSNLLEVGPPDCLLRGAEVVREIAVHGLQLLPEMPRMRTGTSATEEGCPMDFILTVIFYYAEPNRAPKVHRKQRNSFVEWIGQGSTPFQNRRLACEASAPIASAAIFSNNWVDR